MRPPCTDRAFPRQPRFPARPIASPPQSPTVELQAAAALSSRDMGGVKRAAYGIALFVGTACGLDVSGAGEPPTALPERDAGSTADVAVAPPLAPPASCREVLARDPSATNAVYVVDPDGAGPEAPLSVLCEMKTAGGGWTLVARERAGEAGNLRFLAADSQNPNEIASGAASGIVGKRFLGKYKEVWIAWGNASFIRFTLPPTYDLFSNLVDSSIGIADETTSEPQLTTWFTNGGGAQLCVGSGHPDVRPGETSWAVKPRDDSSNGCGCNNAGWNGRGAFYGGAPNGEQTSCTGYGGGWAGVKGEGEAKGGITPPYETLIWIR